MVRLEHNNRGRRTCVEALPHLGGVARWSKRIQNQHLASRRYAGGRYESFPTLPGFPVRMLETPDPYTRCHVPNLEFRLVLHLAPPLGTAYLPTNWLIG